jgi:hypothetical protein
VALGSRATSGSGGGWQSGVNLARLLRRSGWEYLADAGSARPADAAAGWVGFSGCVPVIVLALTPSPHHGANAVLLTT